MSSLREPLIVNARKLRTNMTPWERQLWHHLREKQIDGHRFRRQHLLGSYIVDFVCLEAKLVVELDGGHHAEQIAADRTRQQWLEQEGFRVMRFWNNEVSSNMEGVVAVIRKALNCS